MITLLRSFFARVALRSISIRTVGVRLVVEETSPALAPLAPASRRRGKPKDAMCKRVEWVSRITARSVMAINPATPGYIDQPRGQVRGRVLPLGFADLRAPAQ